MLLSVFVRLTCVQEARVRCVLEWQWQQSQIQMLRDYDVLRSLFYCAQKLRRRADIGQSGHVHLGAVLD